jgi:hypothetical protein
LFPLFWSVFHVPIHQHLSLLTLQFRVSFHLFPLILIYAYLSLLPLQSLFAHHVCVLAAGEPTEAVTSVTCSWKYRDPN